jgi:hypothetical protein
MNVLGGDGERLHAASANHVDQEEDDRDDEQDVGALRPACSW